jgi:hypothetical protein
MLLGITNLYKHAAAWATTITCGALVTAWLPHTIWPSRGTPNIFALILSAPGFVALMPGMMITTYFRSLGYMVFHHAEIARAMASSNENGGVYVVFNDIGLSLSYSFMCSVLVTWALYYMIAWRVLKSRAQRILADATQSAQN